MYGMQFSTETAYPSNDVTRHEDYLRTLNPSTTYRKLCKQMKLILKF